MKKKLKKKLWHPSHYCVEPLCTGTFEGILFIQWHLFGAVRWQRSRPLNRPKLNQNRHRDILRHFIYPMALD
jgi:hypothetical protein